MWSISTYTMWASNERKKVHAHMGLLPLCHKHYYNNKVVFEPIGFIKINLSACGMCFHFDYRFGFAFQSLIRNLQILTFSMVNVQWFQLVRRKKKKKEQIKQKERKEKWHNQCKCAVLRKSCKFQNRNNRLLFSSFWLSSNMQIKYIMITQCLAFSIFSFQVQFCTFSTNFSHANWFFFFKFPSFSCYLYRFFYFINYCFCFVLLISFIRIFLSFVCIYEIIIV